MQVLDEALALWRGPVLGDLHDEFWALPMVTRLDELRLAGLADRIDALSAGGWDARSVGEARSLVAMHPLRSAFVERLMRALDATGRTDEALRVFQEHRELLIDQTGLDPSEALIELDRELARRGRVGSIEPVGRPLRGYVLLEVIGSGSFGTVHRATQPQVGRDVAVKVVNAELADDPTFIHRFEAEAQLVARLEHPHIVPLYDFWREPGGAYLVFRFLRGGTAEGALVREGPFPLERATRLVEQIGGALGCAHAAGVVHRDIKPANILFDEDGEAYLSDFGIARQGPDGEGPRDGSYGGSVGSAGSPMYASPEQARDRVADPRADEYALAVTMWELLTGRPPFEGSSTVEVLAAKLRTPLAPLRAALPGVPSRLDEVLRRASAVHPDDRFGTVAEFVASWQAAVSGASTTTGRLEEVVAGTHPAAATAASLPVVAANPYKGLRPFGEADGLEFFGRDELVADLHRVVCEHEVTAVVGPSGSGKSSLVLAGLVPVLRANGALVVAMTPGDDPFASMSRALTEIGTTANAATLEVANLRRPGGLARAAIALSQSAALTVIIDQLEELWTATDADERAAFLGAVAGMAHGCDDVMVVVTVRADWFDRPLNEPVFGPLVAQSTFGVTPMSAAELHEAISEPAEQVGVRFEAGLVGRLVAEALDQPGSLPLLQFALADLFDRRTGATIGTLGYDEMGGLAGSVAHHADTLYDSCSLDEQASIRRMFARLVTPGEGGEDTRRRARLGQLWGVDDRVVRSFVDSRLLTVDRDRDTREPTVEIAHEALLRSWPRLRQWLDEDRGWVGDLGALASAARLWDAGGRDSADLYRGARLAIIAEQLETRAGALTPVESDFVEASIRHNDAERLAGEERARLRERAEPPVAAIARRARTGPGRRARRRCDRRRPEPARRPATQRRSSRRRAGRRAESDRRPATQRRPGRERAGRRTGTAGRPATGRRRSRRRRGNLGPTHDGDRQPDQRIDPPAFESAGPRRAARRRGLSTRSRRGEVGAVRHVHPQRGLRGLPLRRRCLRHAGDRTAGYGQPGPRIARRRAAGRAGHRVGDGGA